MALESIWLGRTPLLLASTSPTRRLLLTGAGIPTDTAAPEVDERAIEAELEGVALAPSRLARRLAGEKALSVSRRRPERLVVGADQVLALGHQVFHKPGNRAAAREQLLALAGRTHHLHSAAAIARNGHILQETAEHAELTLRSLSAEAIDRYLALAGDAVTQSVGAYQIEGLGIHLFEEVRGDHATILGLPLRGLLQGLRSLGCLAF